MKKNVLGLAILLVSSLTFGQITVFTNKGSKEIKQADCNNKDLKAVIKLPSNASQYDQILVTLQAIAPIAGSDSDPSGGHFTINTSNIKNNQIEAWILNGDNNSDFRIGSYVNKYDITDNCTYQLRHDQIYDVRFAVFGGKILRYEYKDDGGGNMVKNPVYDYTELMREQGNFKMDYGPVSPFVHSEHKVYQIKRYTPDVAAPDLSGGESHDKLTYTVFSETTKGDDLHFVSAAYDASEYDKKDLKADITRILLKNSNPEQSGFENDNFMFSGPGRNAVTFYIPSLVVKANGNLLGKVAEDDEGGFDMGAMSAKEVKSKDRTSEIDAMTKKLGWKSGTLGNVKGEILEVDTYSRNQLDKKGENNFSLKKGAEANSRKLYIFVGESNGKTIISYMFKVTDNDKLSPKQLAFIEEMKKNFTIL